MKKRFSAWSLVLTLVLVAVSLTVLTTQWRETVALRGELETARFDVGQVERLQTENQRLRGKQISAAELEALRADHAAVLRLRQEIEGLQTRAQSRPEGF